MDKDRKKRNYILETNYGQQSLHPNGEHRYFGSLLAAISGMTGINEYGFLGTIDRGRYNGKMLINAAIIDANTGDREMELKVVHPGQGMGCDGEDTPGLYYDFPGTVGGFEKKTGLSFSAFKDYHKDRTSILARYLVSENGLLFKDTLAYEALYSQLKQEAKKRIPYSVSTTSRYFGSGEQRDRGLSGIPFYEEYFYDKAGDAVRDMLAIDYRSLDESVAWESGMGRFHSAVRLLENGIGIGSLISLRLNPLRTDEFWVIEPGIYFETRRPSDLEGFGFPLDLAVKYGKSYPQVFQVGRYDQARANIHIPKEVTEFLKREAKSAGVKIRGQGPRIAAPTDKRSAGRGRKI
ncbi:hypothetical protein JHJ32_07665 [Parapedobacter sp. ISTM3]|uniref:hypothetical protein n=1 Tax=Parapedobacter sp. ISTM3 TaxID=2800130 RepID=UPI00190588BC|nr:hypothetical protein [Parapedobacter sp. ISTM3]MBK1439855.1 hypothetical protein [Parapedobacter sp. ISTM3]